MKVVFRADASIEIGSGHVMRCLTLAEALRERGAECRFVCREFPGHLIEQVRRKGFAVHALPYRAHWQPTETQPAHAAWLGADGMMDAEQTKLGLGGTAPDWLVVDHYGIDARWERALDPHVGKIMVIDDLADRPHECDLLLDQNLQARPDRYAGLVPERCRLLLGSRYALLRPEFRAARERLRTRDGHVRRILVAFGGVDTKGATLIALDALARLAHPEIAVDVVITSAYPHRKAIETRAAAMPNVRLHCDTQDMAGLMAAADLAIGAGGAMSWERCCLGLPAVVMAVADNQREIGRQTARLHTALYLGDADVLKPEALVHVLVGLMRRPGLVRRLGSRGMALVDGHGASRVAAGLTGRLRLTVLSDADSWLPPYLDDLVSGWRRDGHDVQWLHDPADLPAGDCAFFLGVGRVVGPDLLARNAHNLVVHESDLPQGRGWSPLTWQILEGRNRIPITLFEAAQGVDSGPIYLQEHLDFSGHELVDELRAAQAAATAALCRQFVARYPAICVQSRPQRGEASYYPRRRPEDSRLDPDRTLREQFNLLRVVDNDRYPAYLELEGHRYLVRVEKLKS